MVMDATASNSDCQFCSVRFQKSGWRRYCAQDTVSSRSRNCSSLYAATPAIDWVSQDSRKITPMTRPRELENSVVRSPPTRAHFGELASAYRPIFCCSSDSIPMSSREVDSGEPFCTSQTVRKMKRKNCRYSDCQFSATSTPKLADVTYRPNEMGSMPSAVCCWL